MRYTYAVFMPGNMWARTNNKRQALAYARKHRGYVTRMAYASGNGAWDAPTFRACSDLLADFSEDQKAKAFYGWAA